MCKEATRPQWLLRTGAALLILQTCLASQHRRLLAQQPPAQYPCAVLSASNQDYGGGDLERNPRYNTTIDSCTSICVQTAQCEGFALKTDGRCYLKDDSFNSSSILWRYDKYTSVSVSIQACTKPSKLLPLVDPIQTSSPSHLGAILGGIAGGVVVIIVAIILALWYHRRSLKKLRSKQDAAATPPKDELAGSEMQMYMTADKSGVHTASTAPSSADKDSFLDVGGGAEGLPEVRGIALYAQAMPNPQLDNTSDVQQPSGERLADVRAALDWLAAADGSMIDNKYIIDEVSAPVEGGQAIVVMVSSAFAANKHFAMKLFSDHATFVRERDVYAFYAQALGRDDFVYDARDHSADSLPNGAPMPSYIVMLRGVSMRRWITARTVGTAGRIPNPYEVMWMLSEICNQVQILHNLGYVHRDIKPENSLWVQEQNTWRVIDYGSSVPVGSVVPVECTIRFAPPEAVTAFAAKQPLLTLPSLDVYSVGVMVFELITGRSLFPPGATVEDMKETLLGHRLFPHEENPSIFRVAGKLRKTVAAMLSRDPNARPTMAAVVAKFQQLANDTGSTLTSVTAMLPAQRY